MQSPCADRFFQTGLRWLFNSFLDEAFIETSDPFIVRLISVGVIDPTSKDDLAEAVNALFQVHGSGPTSGYSRPLGTVVLLGTVDLLDAVDGAACSTALRSRPIGRPLCARAADNLCGDSPRVIPRSMPVSSRAGRHDMMRLAMRG